MNPFRASPARSTYRNIGVETAVANASPHQLIVLLFDGAIEAVGQARYCMERGDVAGKGVAISKAIRIIGEGLSSALDMEAGGAIAMNLRNLYDYMMKRLLEANLHSQPELLAEVTSLLYELRGVWAQIGQRSATVPVTSMPAPRPERRAVSYGAA
jgi:flagellar protein FliS